MALPERLGSRAVEGLKVIGQHDIWVANHCCCKDRGILGIVHKRQGLLHFLSRRPPCEPSCKRLEEELYQLAVLWEIPRHDLQQFCLRDSTEDEFKLPTLIEIFHLACQGRLPLLICWEDDHGEQGIRVREDRVSSWTHWRSG